MKRDWRLLASIVALLVSALAEIRHTIFLQEWSIAYGSGDERTMEHKFGVVRGDCKADCFGWGTYPGDAFEYIALASFVGAILLIGWAWLKPR